MAVAADQPGAVPAEAFWHRAEHVLLIAAALGLVVAVLSRADAGGYTWGFLVPVTAMSMAGRMRVKAARVSAAPSRVSARATVLTGAVLWVAVASWPWVDAWLTALGVAAGIVVLAEDWRPAVGRAAPRTSLRPQAEEGR